MKRKFLIVLLSLVCALCLALGLTACNKGTTGGGTSGGTEQSGTEQGDDDEQSGTEQSGTEQGGTEQDDTEQGSDSEQGDDEQGDTEQGGTEQGGTEQGDDERGDTEQGDTEQGDTEQGGIEITVTLNYSLSDDGNSYTVSGIGSCTDTDIEIPSTYDGKPVTAIGDSAFYECTDIVTITIPESVITIGDSAFYGCSSLKSVTIPNSVTTIGASAFGDCSALVTITIGSGVISIGSGAFSGCYKLLEIYNLSTLSITSGSSDNGGAAYYAKEVYTSTEGESKISEVSDFIFYNDNGAYYLVGYTGSDTEITLPDSVNGSGYEIYDYAFYYNTKLTKVVISDGVTAIGNAAFTYCYSLVSLTIGRKVTSISNSAFSDCQKLIEVYNLSSLNIAAETGNLSDIEYLYANSDYVMTYAYNVYTATEGESKLIYKNDYIFYNDDGTYYLLGYKGTATEITLPKDINGNTYIIYKFAFYYNTELTSINIPDSVTTIGYYAFYNCSSLKGVTIPDSVTTIYGYAFYDCTSLTNLTIGNSVTSIGDYAFYNCTSLTNVVIPDNVTSIGYSAFAYCISLTNLTIGNSVMSIGSCAFLCCCSLTGIIIPDSVKSIGSSAFEGCYSLVSVTIGSSVTSIAPYAFSCCYKLIEVYNLSSLDIMTAADGYYDNISYDRWDYLTFYAYNVYTATSGSSNLIYEGDYIFYNNNGTYYLMGYTGTATEITLPDSINGNSYAIYDYAFCYCSSLKNVTIPKGVTSIGRYAFAVCNRLTSVTIPDSVTAIGEYAFVYCTSFTNINVDSGNTAYKSIDGNLYNYDGTTLIQYASGKTETSFIIPDSVISIGGYAFVNCTSLTSVTIGSGVTSIGEYAFAGCNRLTSVIFENTSGWYVTRIGTDILSNDLADTSTAATYLTDTYYNYYWYRRES